MKGLQVDVRSLKLTAAFAPETMDGKGIPFSFPFGARGIFRGKLAVSLPEATFLRHFLFNVDQVAFLF